MLFDLSHNAYFSSTASNEDSVHQQEVELAKISQETLLMDRLTQGHQAYPPDLLSFPLRGPQVSPGTSQAHNSADSPKSPGYSAISINNMYRIQAPYQGSIPLISQKGYVTLPRRPRNPDPQVFSTLNGVIPYYDTFNMKLFGHGSNYYSLNKSEMDLGPVGKIPNFRDSEEMEPAPSPAPGTPHATVPRNSLSSPNIHNQLLALQSMANLKASERPLKVLLMENESFLRNPKDLRINYSVSGTLGRRTAPKPPPKPKKRNVCDVKEAFLMTSDNATQV